jgi:glycosyltransferase involved in cell wall biosynthesis
MNQNVNDNSKDIIFFSLHYPYNFSDSYLDEEINLLSAQYRKVIIVTANTFDSYIRSIPSNAIVYRFSANNTKPSVLGSMSLLFQPFFYKEIISIVGKYRIPLSYRLLKEMFAFYFRTLATESFIKRIVKEQHVNTDNLLIYTYWMLETTLAAVLLKKTDPLLKVISKAHSQDVYFFRNPAGYAPFRKYIFDGLEHLYFISENALNYFVKKHKLAGAEMDKVSVSRIGIPGPGYFIDKEHDGKLRIISVAYIQKLKRIELIIDALSMVEDIEIDWFHVGQADSSEYFDQIKEYAQKKLSGMPNITFTFKGQIPKPVLFQIYSESKFDLLLNVSETEGIPVSMMEAMSYSVPVLGTEVGGVAEIIEDRVNGFLLPANVTAMEIADRLRKYFLMENKIKKDFRLAAYNTWNEKYSSESNYSLFVKTVINL